MDKFGAHFFGQYLVKLSLLNEVDCLHFLVEITKSEYENNTQKREALIKEIYNTYLVKTSSNYINLPKAIKNPIDNAVKSSPIPQKIYGDSYIFLMTKLVPLWQEYLVSPTYEKWRIISGKRNTTFTTTPTPQNQIEVSESEIGASSKNEENNRNWNIQNTNFSVTETIIVRRFNKRGGIRIPIPNTIEEILENASQKLKIKAQTIREPETEAEICEIYLLKPNMVLWVMTKEEAQLFH